MDRDKMFKTEKKYTISYSKNGRNHTKTYINHEWDDRGAARVWALRAQGIKVVVTVTKTES